jgi:hypothetical protein
MARALLALMVLGSLGWAVSWQPLHSVPAPRSDRRELERFAEEVARRTPPRASIFFILPPEDADGGLANHRLRYLLGERYVATNLDKFSPPLQRIDYVAVWRDGRGRLEAAH